MPTQPSPPADPPCGPHVTLDRAKKAVEALVEVDPEGRYDHEFYRAQAILLIFLAQREIDRIEADERIDRLKRANGDFPP